MKFVVACYQFFGKLPGQTMSQFAEELKNLTPKDREELKPLLEREMKGTIED